jgi:hypothetical protein
MGRLRDLMQSASNTAASNVSGPVDLIGMLLRYGGIPLPQDAVGSSQWMAQKGLTRPVQQGAAQVAGDTLALLAPIGAAAKAPQIARGILAGEEAAKRGAYAVGEKADDMAQGYMQRSGLAPGATAPAYQIDHKPMTKAGGASTLDDLLPSFGEDIYGKNALQYFGSGDARERNIVRTLAALRGKPNAPVTIYRGVPNGASGINAGDWVTIDPKVAADYAAQHAGGRVVSMQVPASHVTSWADSLLEFGYHPPK